MLLVTEKIATNYALSIKFLSPLEVLRKNVGPCCANWEFERSTATFIEMEKLSKNFKLMRRKSRKEANLDMLVGNCINDLVTKFSYQCIDMV